MLLSCSSTKLVGIGVAVKHTCSGGTGSYQCTFVGSNHQQGVHENKQLLGKLLTYCFGSVTLVAPQSGAGSATHANEMCK
jgi:hypothetical protein